MGYTERTDMRPIEIAGAGGYLPGLRGPENAPVSLVQEAPPLMLP
jgi:hypothetical protein